MGRSGTPSAQGLSNFFGKGFAITAFDDAIYLGGEFGRLGDLDDGGYMGRWDGTEWRRVGEGLSDLIRAVVYLGDHVYVGGDFQNAGGIGDADYLARWDGERWHPVGTGAGPLNGVVTALTVSGSDLWVGGAFQNAGGLSNADGVAHWDGTEWNNAGTGIDNASVYRYPSALLVDGDDLYVGGSFDRVGGVEATARIARWDREAVVGWWRPGLRRRVRARSEGGWHLRGRLVPKRGRRPERRLPRAVGRIGLGAPRPSTRRRRLRPPVLRRSPLRWGQLQQRRRDRRNGLDRPMGRNGVERDGGPSLQRRVRPRTPLRRRRCWGSVRSGGVVNTARCAALRTEGLGYVSAWDGTKWRAVASGIGPGSLSNAGVYALALDSGRLAAGGEFATAGDGQSFRFATISDPSFSVAAETDRVADASLQLRAAPNPVSSATQLTVSIDQPASPSPG